jgi:hypothetical protein
LHFEKIFSQKIAVHPGPAQEECLVETLFLSGEATS